MLPVGEVGYLCSDLNKLVDKWYDGYMRSDIFPQYATMVNHEKQAVKAKGDAYEDLKAMIGLTDAKSVITQSLDYYKLQKLLQQKGVHNEQPAMHMCFSGNPGTAKTSAARLIAQILKDNNLLAVGDLIEVGRADLVGKYVGWTAQIVKEKFVEAKGSVLFIDEAYSLVDDRNGSYGDEAINTIVQEMENARENTIVIFAGYPDKMEGFLQKNPGLKSRIAFHVDFPDYKEEELFDILRLMLKKQELNLADGAEEKVSKILMQVAMQENYGNGRYVRNLLEKARLKQATRLVAMDWDTVTPATLCTLIADDFDIPLDTSKQKVTMGFSA
jgi:SpoVK/Ycf46/Vps4 family AAA+-type ATPase